MVCGGSKAARNTDTDYESAALTAELRALQGLSEAASFTVVETVVGSKRFAPFSLFMVGADQTGFCRGQEQVKSQNAKVRSQKCGGGCAATFFE